MAKRDKKKQTPRCPPHNPGATTVQNIVGIKIHVTRCTRCGATGQRPTSGGTWRWR